ncbi:MAG: addiction module antidote protein [Candidatus Sulfotelmatobacter sp.]
MPTSPPSTSKLHWKTPTSPTCSSSLCAASPKQGGIAKVAKAAGIERESLYRALSARGNPRLSTLVAVTKAVGLKLTVEPAP